MEGARVEHQAYGRRVENDGRDHHALDVLIGQDRPRLGLGHALRRRGPHDPLPRHVEQARRLDEVVDTEEAEHGLAERFPERLEPTACGDRERLAADREHGRVLLEAALVWAQVQKGEPAACVDEEQAGAPVDLDRHVEALIVDEERHLVFDAGRAFSAGTTERGRAGGG